MAVGTIPFLTSDTNYRLVLPIDGEQYLFDVRWNSRDAAWYIDMYEADETPIAMGLKITIGISIGRTCQHQFFRDHILHAIDSSGAGRDATFDDLGTRVVVQVISVSELGF